MSRGEEILLPPSIILGVFIVQNSASLLLEMTGIVKTFAGTHALKGVDFTCESGEIHCLVGENGAGKSTLMKVLAGIHSPDSGKINVRGTEVRFSNYSEARKAGVGVVYQELSLLPQLTVAENIAMGVWPKDQLGLVNWKQIRETSNAILSGIGVSIDPDVLVSSLPMAKRQMVEIGKVLAQKPDLIIFDEPTAPLSHDEVVVLFNIIRDLKAQGKGIIFISHRLEEVLSISDRITVMKDGLKVITDTTSNFDEKKLISSMVGRELSEIFPPKQKALDQQRAIFTYDRVDPQSQSRVAFAVREGEVLGVGGLQGQGQLELLQSIFGVGDCDYLNLTINAKEVSVKSPRQAMRHGIALIPENRNEEGVFLILSALENLAAPTIDHRARGGFVDKKKEAAVIADMIDQLSIKVSSSRQIAQSLSGGNMQKLVIGKWLIFSPKVIVLLEPTKGVDVATKQQIYLIIRKLADSGVAVIVNTNDMIELIGLCDRVLVVNQGVITSNLSGEQVTEENIMEASVSRRNIITAETLL
jgi:ABC-type sugar transport system ATPase subunit